MSYVIELIFFSRLWFCVVLNMMGQQALTCHPVGALVFQAPWKPGDLWVAYLGICFSPFHLASPPRPEVLSPSLMLRSLNADAPETC